MSTTTVTALPATRPARRRTAPKPAPRPDLRLIPGLVDPEPVQLALDFDWDVAPGVPAVPPAPRRLRLIATAGDLAEAQPVGRTDEPGELLPDPGQWAARLARAVAEVAVGERPSAQLTRWVARAELAKLADRSSHVSRHPSARSQQGVTHIRTVRAVRVCPVAPGIVETSAVLVGSGRAQAVAIRLEVVNGRWLATAVDLR